MMTATETPLCLCGCGEEARHKFVWGHDARLRNYIMRERWGTVKAMAEAHDIDYPDEGKGSDFVAWGEVLALYGRDTERFARENGWRP